MESAAVKSSPWICPFFFCVLSLSVVLEVNDVNRLLPKSNRTNKGAFASLLLVGRVSFHSSPYGGGQRVVMYPSFFHPQFIDPMWCIEGRSGVPTVGCLGKRKRCLGWLHLWSLPGLLLITAARCCHRQHCLTWRSGWRADYFWPRKMSKVWGALWKMCDKIKERKMVVKSINWSMSTLFYCWCSRESPRGHCWPWTHAQDATSVDQDCCSWAERFSISEDIHPAGSSWGWTGL